MLGASGALGASMTLHNACNAQLAPEVAGLPSCLAVTASVYQYQSIVYEHADAQAGSDPTSMLTHRLALTRA